MELIAVVMRSPTVGQRFEDAKALLAALPPGLDPERKAVVETACQLVGKVNYFWGGKSRVLGWDERWGQIKKVTASRQFYLRDLPSFWAGLFGFRGLGVLQCDWRSLYHRPWRRSTRSTHLLHPHHLGPGYPWRFGFLSGGHPCGHRGRQRPKRKFAYHPLHLQQKQCGDYGQRWLCHCWQAAVLLRIKVTGKLAGNIFIGA